MTIKEFISVFQYFFITSATIIIWNIFGYYCAELLVKIWNLSDDWTYEIKFGFASTSCIWIIYWLSYYWKY